MKPDLQLKLHEVRKRVCRSRYLTLETICSQTLNYLLFGFRISDDNSNTYKQVPELCPAQFSSAKRKC